MSAPDEPEFKGRKPQPLPIRITHWLNIPFLVIMAASGLQILMAYPYMGPHGHPYAWWPMQGFGVPSWLRMGGWLGGARAWHFTVAWLLLVNALVYLGYMLATREFKRRWFSPKRDAKGALETVKYYVRIRKTAPEQGFYNGLQRAAYTGAVVLALVEVLSGLAIWKPVQLSWLTAMFGGYDAARAVHFLGLLALVGFLVGHLVMVFAHPKSLVEMITGGKRHE